MVRRRLSRNLTPEEGLVPYRVVTAMTVVVAVVAGVLQDAVVLSTGIAAAVLVAVGSVFSYVRRGKRNVLVKVALTGALFFAFANFVGAVRLAATIDDTRAPLVALFLWVLVMHSFDVPRRRDLSFSLAASVVLVALAGSLAFSSGFIVLVLTYSLLLMAALVLAYDADLRAGASHRAREKALPAAARPRRAAAGRRAAALALATLMASSVVFVFLPRLPGAQVAALPFSLNPTNQIGNFVGSVVLPRLRGGGGDGSGGIDPDTYFGYGDSLDLRTRGELSEDLVLRVRTPRPALYRGQVFDLYEDGLWTSTDDDLEEIGAGSFDSIVVPTPAGERGTGSELIQTFYVERELPNVVFHAHRAREVFISSSRMHMDRSASLRLPFTLEEDTIYSVISRVPDATFEELKAAGPADRDDPELARFLQVPESLKGRFRDLALEVTSPYPTAAEKASAVEAWLHRNKEYRLDISPDPPGRDPVDFFVFHRDEGFCEQIAATMALMLRASGVPARIVVGFGPGERNLFTGYWEVRNSDAHAWVEVFYPDVGWIPYDPTFGVPMSSAANTTFMLEPLSRMLSGLPLESLRDAAGSLSSAIRALPGPGAAVVPVLLLAVLVLIGAVVRRRLVGRDVPAPSRAVQAWMDLERALSSRGLRRADHETALEFARRASGELNMDVLELADLFASVRYGPPDVPAARAEEWAARARDAAADIRRKPARV